MNKKLLSTAVASSLILGGLAAPAQAADGSSSSLSADGSASKAFEGSSNFFEGSANMSESSSDGNSLVGAVIALAVLGGVFALIGGANKANGQASSFDLPNLFNGGSSQGAPGKAPAKR